MLSKHWPNINPPKLYFMDLKPVHATHPLWMFQQQPIYLLNCEDRHVTATNFPYIDVISDVTESQK